MNIIILGCGRTGSTIATSLARDGHNVSIIDRSNEAFRRLGADFGGNKIVGNGIDEAVLKRAGIEKANAFVAVTNGDNTNIMSVQIAKNRFDVQKVVCRIKDPIRACAYRELGIETICTTMIGARVMKDYVMGKDLGPIGEYCALSDDEAVL